MAIGDVYQVNFWQEVNGNPVMSRLHYLETAAPTDPDAVPLSIADGFQSAVADAWATVLSDQWSGTLIQVGRIVPTPINPYSKALVGGDAVVGAVASEPVPSNSPLVVSKYTSLAAKAGRGRWYQSGIPETIQDGGQILAASLAGLQTAANGMLVVLAEVTAGAGRWTAAVRSETGAGQTTVLTHVVPRPNLANMRPRRSPNATV